MSTKVTANVVSPRGDVFARGVVLDLENIDGTFFVSCGGVTLDEVTPGVFRCIRPCAQQCGWSQRGRTIVLVDDALLVPA